MPASTLPVKPTYRGRFAPSPTGPLHFGSLAAAVAGYLQARSLNGEWLVRIEDIDPPREVPGATGSILRCLEAHGFEYPEPLFQSSRVGDYAELTSRLLQNGDAYLCSCTRRNLQANASRGRTGLIYPGTCRSGADQSTRTAVAARARTTPETLSFNDSLQGIQECCVEPEIGDFLIRRGDGLPAYQLAVVADDHYQGITEVVRGTDLLDATFMQIWLQRLLGFATPQYMHVPVAAHPDGSKLSKQTGAPEVNLRTPVTNIFHTLVFLKQNPDENLQNASLAETWDWAVENWRPEKLIGHRSLPYQGMILQ